MSNEDKKLGGSQGGEGANLEIGKGANNQSLEDGGNANISEKEKEALKRAEEAEKRAKGLDAAVLRLKKEKEEQEARAEADRLAKLEEKDQLKEYKTKAETLEKKEKLRELCEAKGLIANEIMSSAMQMSINDLDAFTTNLANLRDKTKQEAIESAKRQLQENANYHKPTGSSLNLTGEEATEKMLRDKGLL